MNVTLFGFTLSLLTIGYILIVIGWAAQLLISLKHKRRAPKITQAFLLLELSGFGLIIFTTTNRFTNFSIESIAFSAIALLIFILLIKTK